VKAEACWASNQFVHSSEHLFLIRQFLALDMQCPLCCKLTYDPDTTSLGFYTPPPTLHWSRRWEWPWAILVGELNQDCECLDAGSAGTVFKYLLSTQVRHVVAYDRCERFLREAEATSLFYQFRDKISIEVGDIADLPKEKYDRSFCLSTLEHSENPGRLFTKVVESVRPGGIALISVDVSNKVVPNECSINYEIAEQMCKSVGIVLPEQKENDDTQAGFASWRCRCLCVKVWV
jgi:2-polyprenyl-3-methyl-5-hydroxy-6-metoxy-1,4-benzoquinol methylase